MGIAADLDQLRQSALATSNTILARDLGERRRMDEARNLLASIVESSDDAIITTDPDGHITTWNRAAERLFGYAAAEVLGRLVTLLFPPGQEDEETAIHSRTRTITLRESFDAARLCKDGRVVDVAVTINPVIGTDGTLVGTSRIVRDVTERKRAAERLERSNRDLEEFAYIASHDLQAPLRSVCGFAQLLQRHAASGLDPRSTEYLQQIVSSAHHMESLIQGLLEYSRVGREDSTPERVDANVSLEQALAQLREAIDSSGAMITRDPLPAVLGSAVELTQLLQNLVGNALKFRRAGEPPQIAITGERTANGCRFAIADRGIGIDAAHYGKLFKMFQRLHTREEYEGTGIGLAVCQRIVQRNGGRIWLESVPGYGTTFHFTLPAG